MLARKKMRKYFIKKSFTLKKQGIDIRKSPPPINKHQRKTPTELALLKIRVNRAKENLSSFVMDS